MTKTQPKVAFIIVCWNNEDLLQECFESIEKQTYRNHVTVMIDNGSADNSVATARRLKPDAIIIEAGENLAFAKGNNVAIAHALKDTEIEYVALLNSDATLDEKWLEQIIDFAAGKPKGACFQGTTLDYYNHEIIDSTHIFIAHNSQATQGNWRNPYTRELGPLKVLGVNAAACVVSRAFIDAQPFGAEFFDEDMFMYLEDVDVAVRATMMGWDNYLVPQARAYHMGSASSGKNPGFSLYMTFRNNSALIFKNYPFLTALKLFVRMPRSDRATYKHLVHLGNKAAAQKVLKGRINGLFRLPLYIGKRRAMRRRSGLSIWISTRPLPPL
jgi:GT2 family glycosyltransferase